MVDYTAVIDAPRNVADRYDLNLSNTLIWVAMLVSSLALRFVGSNTSNAGLTQLGGIFFGLSLLPLAIEVVGGSYFRSPATDGQAGFAYWLPIVFLNIGGIVSSLPFSLVPTPDSQGAYAASALAGVSSGVFNWVIGFAAPHGESYALGAIGIILLIGVIERFDGLTQLLAVLTVLGGTGGTFALLHGARTAGFLLTAGTFMVVTLGWLVSPEIEGFEIPGSDWLPITWLFFAGVHVGWNRATLDGGLIGFYSEILTLTGDALLVALLIVGVEAYLLLNALIYVARTVLRFR